MKDTLYAVAISLIVIAIFTVVMYFFFPVTPYEPAVKIRIIEDVEQNAQDMLDELREMRKEQEELHREMLELNELLEQYHRGTLKSA